MSPIKPKEKNPIQPVADTRVVDGQLYSFKQITSPKQMMRYKTLEEEKGFLPRSSTQVCDFPAPLAQMQTELDV